MISFGTGLIVHELDWASFAQIVHAKALSIQHAFETSPNIDVGYYIVYAIDERIAYKTVIYKGTIPVVTDVDQTTNDAAKVDFETNYIGLSNKRLSPATQGTEAALKVSQVGREGDEIVWATHNFADQTSWFSNAVQQVNVPMLSDDGGYTWYASGSLKNQPWVDLYNGKVLHENNIREAANGYYDIVVTTDGETRGMKDCLANCPHCTGDFTVNFTSGVVSFSNPVTASSVLATFCTPTDAWWVLKAKPGTILNVEGAEMQFSEDIILTDNIMMQIQGYVQVFAPQYWQGNGGPLPTNYLITLAEYEYKSLAEFVDETDGAFPVMPGIGGAVRGLKSSMFGMPFKYNTIRSLIGDYGLQIRVGLKHNHEFGGFRATATFYCTERVL